MLLPASAWTTFSGQRFGLRVARPWEGDRLPYDVTSVDVRAAQKDHAHLLATLTWTAALAAATPITTIAGACPTPAGACGLSSQTTANQIGRASFGMRPDLTRTIHRQPLTFSARTPSTFLFDLVMPWPR